MEAEFKDFSDIDWDTFLQNLTLTPNLTVINVGDWDDFLKDNNATTIIRHNTDLVHFTPNDEENLSGRVEISWDQLNQTEKEKEILRKYGFSPFNKDTALPMTVFYSVLFLAGVPGNFLTCFSQRPASCSAFVPRWHQNLIQKMYSSPQVPLQCGSSKIPTT